MSRLPREVLIRNLLRDGWNADNTYGLRPDISFGWFDDEQDQPQAVVRTPEETTTTGGTGFDAMGVDGPTQTRTGTLNIHTFARSRELDGASTDFPRQYLSGGSSSHGVTGEIRRVISANTVGPVDPDTSERPVQALANETVVEAPEPDTGDEVVHFRNAVTYYYRDER